MRCATTLVQSFVIVLSLSGCGCGLFCHPYSTVVCPAGAFVGESVEAAVIVVVGEDISIGWSVAGEAELVDETSESAVITPTGPGVITVTVTATDERTGDSAIRLHVSSMPSRRATQGAAGFSPREAS